MMLGEVERAPDLAKTLADEDEEEDEEGGASHDGGLDWMGRKGRVEAGQKSVRGQGTNVGPRASTAGLTSERDVETG